MAVHFTLKSDNSMSTYGFVCDYLRALADMAGNVGLSQPLAKI